MFNNQKNKDGSQIKIIIGTPAIKEGISLFSIKFIHIIDLPWNYSKFEQIIGRGFRYCSHKYIIKQKPILKILIYMSYKTWSKTQIIDWKILDMINKKAILIRTIENIIKDTAIDKLILNP